MGKLKKESGCDNPSEEEYFDEHLGCPSYPECDEAPLGCLVEQDIDNVEWYGARD